MKDLFKIRKNYIILCFVCLFFLFSNFRIVKSQDLFNQYLSSYSKYKSDRESFLISLDNFLAYKSLSSEAEAIEKAKKMISSKLELVEIYLKFLGNKLSLEAKGDESLKNQIYSEIENKIGEIALLKDELESYRTLSGLNKFDQDFKGKYASVELLSFKTLAFLGFSKFSNFINILSGEIDILEKYAKEAETKDQKKNFLLEERTNKLKDSFGLIKTKSEENFNKFSNEINLNNSKEVYFHYLDSLESLRLELDQFILSFEETTELIKNL